jgi:hypothetical protein
MTAAQTARAWAVGFSVVIASTGLLMFAVGSVEQAQKRDEQVAALIDQTKADRKQMRMMAGQLADATAQNAELVELLRASGVEPPASLVTTRTTTRIERDRDNGDNSDDSDNGSDTPTTSRPTTAPRPTTRPTTSPPSDDSDDLTDVVPVVPLPDAAGRVTDDAKKLADDTLDDVPLIQ